MFEILNATRHPDLLELLFEQVVKDGDDKMFHPHPFTKDYISKIVNSKDMYFLMLINGDVAGYGLLRGWDEGFEIPSLGIYIVKSFRGRGLAVQLMHHMHLAASLHKASSVRLKVYKTNQSAVKLYTSLGYVLQEYDRYQLIGSKQLER
jgi:ribosomal protein S18 acetylase RimI-like enzyme